MTKLLVTLFKRCHGDDVESPAGRAALGAFAGAVGIVCNVLLCLGKGVVGLAAGSLSIVADAVNNLSDAASNIVSLVGFRVASRPADHGHPYGHGRMEYLAGVTVAFVIIFVGIELCRESFGKIVAPEQPEFNAPVVCVLVAAILVKLWMAAFNRTVGRTIDATVLMAAAADSRNDVVATSAVLVSAVVAHVTGVALDGWMGLAVGAFILWSGANLVRDTMDPLLGSAPDPELVERIHDRIMSYPGVLGTHDLMVHDYGPGRRFASVHVEMAAEADVLASHDVIDTIEQDFLATENLVMTIHFDPIVTSDESVKTLRYWLAEQVASIDPRLSVHDVRAVPGPTHTNVIFDCLKPRGVDLGDEELRARICARVEAERPDYVCKVTVDSDYVSSHQ
jgi:cation diffusion facilitator family transporter